MSRGAPLKVVEGGGKGGRGWCLEQGRLGVWRKDLLGGGGGINAQCRKSREMQEAAGPRCWIRASVLMCEMEGRSPQAKSQKNWPSPNQQMEMQGFRDEAAVDLEPEEFRGVPPGVGRVEVCRLPRCGGQRTGEKAVSAQTPSWPRVKPWRTVQ